MTYQIIMVDEVSKKAVITRTRIEETLFGIKDDYYEGQVTGVLGDINPWRKLYVNEKLVDYFKSKAIKNGWCVIDYRA